MTAPDQRRGCRGRPRAACWDGSAHTVLVVDDDEAVRAALPVLLSGPGVSVETEGTVEGARRRLERARVDLVITDLCFGSRSDRGGLELISWLQRRFSVTPVVLLTAFDDPDVRAEARRRGAVALWSKSLGPAEFVARAHALLGGTGPARPPTASRV